MNLSFKVSAQFGKWLISRKSADLMFSQVKDLIDNSSRLVDIDFLGVSFVSRSFADQLFKAIASYESDVSVRIVNPSRNILNLLVATKFNSTKNRQLDDKHYPVYTTNSKKEYLSRLGV
ncbi:MAG TPA: hypothetical protein VL728_12850 [Cyclobacteriaceae bacterium]|jgi:anti-anti-sigma regulatory factor|nr:hypothetical protein [Cyclobacteriaceae bacterium]